MSSTKSIVFPGEEVPASILPIPKSPKNALKLGSGLMHTPPSTVTSTHAGPLGINYKKNSIWVDSSGGKYIPHTGDLVVATVHHSSAEVYQCSITPHTAFAQLPQLAFEGATKKSRPQLSHGSLVYARIASASKYTEPELLCYNASTGKSEGMGELKGGMVFDISLSMASRLLMAKSREEGRITVLEDIAEKIAFEIAIGRNGRIWIKSGGIKETLVVGKALQETDNGALGVEEQRKLAKKLLKGS